MIAVIKDNAYGLGIENILPLLKEIGIREIAFSTVKEIRDYFEWTKEAKGSKIEQDRNYEFSVFLLEDFLQEELSELLIFGSSNESDTIPVTTSVTIPITSIEKAKMVQAWAKKKQRKVKVWVPIDTGMGRLGVPYELAKDFFREVVALDHLVIEQVYSHLSSSDELNNKQTTSQMNRLEEVKKILERNYPSLAIDKIPFHIENSFSIMNFHQITPRSLVKRVRLGIGSYGVYREYNQAMGTSLAFSLRSRIISKRFLPRGFTIGYNSTYVLQRDSWVGTVAAGYGDGVPFALGTIDGVPHATVLVGREENGWKRANIIGKISMDFFTIDLTDVNHEQIAEGDEVILLGAGIEVEEWSEKKRTIPYEIMTSLNTYRMERLLL